MNREMRTREEIQNDLNDIIKNSDLGMYPKQLFHLHQIAVLLMDIRDLLANDKEEK